MDEMLRDLDLIRWGVYFAGRREKHPGYRMDLEALLQSIDILRRRMEQYANPSKLRNCEHCGVALPAEHEAVYCSNACAIEDA